MTEFLIRLCKVNSTLVRLNKLDIQHKWHGVFSSIILSLCRSLSNRNQSIGFQSKSMDLFLYGKDLCHEKVKKSYLFEVYSIFMSAFNKSQMLLMASSPCMINRNLHTILTSSYYLYENLLNNWNYPPDISNIQHRPAEWMIYFI